MSSRGLLHRLPVPPGHLPWLLSIGATAAALPFAARRRSAQAVLGVLGPMAVAGAVDVVQAEHSIRRNFPAVARLRWLLEDIRPEIRQYFIEGDTEQTPFSRRARSLVYARAKGEVHDVPFGTEDDLYAEGAEWVLHSLQARDQLEDEPRVRVGGPHVTQPYDMSLLNVSAMSFGSLSAPAIRALNTGAALGGFAHSTGEGGISRHHREPGGDLIWQIGTGYFGCRTPDGGFDADLFAATASDSQVKMVTVKLSQGAKPGKGGRMPGAKVSAEIAEIRGLPVGQPVISPPVHSTFSSPLEMVAWVDELRRACGGKPVGIKLCVGAPHEVMGIFKAMAETGGGPDYILVDGAEGGTGAAPVEFSDAVGTPLTEGLVLVHNGLVGAGLRDRVRVGAAGKISSGFDMVKRMCQGADFAMAARAMMFAVGCIQAEECHTNTCPTGVATQDPRLTRALDVDDKAPRVHRYHHETVHACLSLVAAMGVDGPARLHPAMLYQRQADGRVLSFDELHPPLEPGALLEGTAPEAWQAMWRRGRPDSFEMAR